MALEIITQKNLVQVFKKLGYEHIGDNVKLFGNSPRLDDNFRKQIEVLNKEALNGKGLSDTEFQRLRNEYPKNHREAFQIFRNGVLIVLDNNSRVHIKFIDKKDFSKNVFQVTTELTVKGIKTNRLDVVAMINGVPIVNIELKKAGRSGGGIEAAIGQINRYSNNGIYHQDLLNFMQLFVASDSVATKYFSVDPRTERGEASYGEYAFTWMDSNNDFVNKIEDFANTFFEKEFIHRLLINYMLMKPLPSEQIMVLRPYQIHATHAIVSTVELGLGMNTYVSASTGSGKTLTSFKLTEVLASKGHKTLTLLDRNDLADQTTSEYKQFDTTGLIKDLVKSRDLHKALMDPNEKAVITTIQSFTAWIERYPKSSLKLADGRDVVIIVDECHRSTSNDMFATIKRAFLDKEKNILKCNLVGFTGTPLLEENAPSANQMTQNTFGEVSHIYTITEAIRDDSVLPFKPFSIEISSSNNPDVLTGEYFGHHARIEANVSEILKQFKNLTLQMDDVKGIDTGGFVGMLAAENKASAAHYWSLIREGFKRQNRTAAIVFSIQENAMWNKSAITEESFYEKILEAYDEDFGTSFLQIFKKDSALGRKSHLSDVVKRSKMAGIDMLVVSDMLLTGYDNQFLNTIYLDKKLKDHGLLQAASRVNRLAGPLKKTGNIVFFSDRNMMPAFENCLKLFGTAVNIEEVVDYTSFKDAEKLLRKAVFELRDLVATPDDLRNIETEDELREVIQAYRSVVNALNDIRIYPEWDESVGYVRAGISRDEIDLYYSNIMLAKSRILVDDPDDDESDIQVSDFIVSTVDGDVIGYNYILKLLNNFVASPPSERDRWLRRCEEILRNTTDAEILQNLPAIERVLEAARNDLINTVDDLFERLDLEIKAERVFALQNFRNSFNLPEAIVDEMVEVKLSGGRGLTRLGLKRILGAHKFDSTNLVQILESFDELFVEEK